MRPLAPATARLLTIAAALVAVGSCARVGAIPPLSQADSLAIIGENQAHRAAMDAFFRSSPDSPFVRDTTIAYHGIAWFPVNPAFRGRSRLTHYPAPDTVTVFGTKGEERRQLRYGYFEIVVPGDDGLPVTLRLNAYKFTPYDPLRYEHFPENLSVWFTDRTTGAETYSVGRYVEVGDDTHDPSTVYTVDLNKAYNPYCAYSHLYSCAVPRKEDHLDISLRVGELTYQH
jgi:uncharacterized protein (DUF1684 family)